MAEIVLVKEECDTGDVKEEYVKKEEPLENIEGGIHITNIRTLYT